MRIHTDTLTMDDILAAARTARVSLTRRTEHKSRSHARAFDIILAGESRRRQNGGEDYAATWDQWGVFLGELFDKDESMVTPYYASAAAFHHQTACRFEDGWPADAHGDHKFDWNGRQTACRKCSATMTYAA